MASPTLSIAQWVDEIESVLNLPHVRRVRIPLAPVIAASVASAYRLLAREQLLMLRMPHVLATDAARALGWTPSRTNAETVRETTVRLTESS